MGLPPIIADGITYACALALLGCGITLLYICTRTFNFAHGCMATWGLYIMYTGVAVFGINPYYSLPLAFVLGAVLGVICYVCINRPLLRREASAITLMMSTLGYDLILLSSIQIYCDYLTHEFKLYPRMITMSMYDFEIGGVKAATVITSISMVAIIILLHLFISKTKFGTAIRATIENPPLSSLSGVNSDMVYLTAWIIGGGLACMGGAMISMVQTGSPVMGWLIIVAMFASSILGGLYSIYGGIFGGLVVGLAEYIGSYLLTRPLGPWILAYRPVIPLIIMSIALLAFPKGLAGLPWFRLAERLKKLITYKVGER